MKPSVGRTVHYHHLGTPGEEWRKPCAAIITECEPAEIRNADADDPEENWYDVKVYVLNPQGVFFTDVLPFSEEPKPGCWSWPPRV